MCAPIEEVERLERINYAATLLAAEVTPGLDVLLRDDVVIISSEVFPVSDVNHACLLRAAEQTADRLITEVIGYFEARGIPPLVFISPACTPADLDARLLDRGFARQDTDEAWMVLRHLASFEIPSPFPGIETRKIRPDETLTVAEIFMTAFEIPVDFAPLMVQLLEPSLEIPGHNHYIALVDGRPAGVCSLICYQDVAILGSGAVLPAYRRRGVASNMAIWSALEALNAGADTLMVQTAAGTALERLLRISGFENVFTRTCYTLS